MADILHDWEEERVILAGEASDEIAVDSGWSPLRRSVGHFILSVPHERLTVLCVFKDYESSHMTAFCNVKSVTSRTT